MDILNTPIASMVAAVPTPPQADVSWFHHISQFEFTSMMGMLLYWLPLAICAIGYSIETWVNYQKDLTDRARQGENYRPTDTVGDLIGRALVTTIPLANLWVAVFCSGPEYLGNFFRRIGALFNQPLVPKKK